MKKPVSNPAQEVTASALRPEVAAVYAVRDGLQSVFACAEFGRVDLSDVDLQYAEQLAEKGYLKKLDQPDP